MAHEGVSLALFQTVQDDVATLNRIVIEGNGEPALTSRMTAAEQSIKTLVQVGWVAITAMFTTAGLVIADLFVRHVK